MRIGTMTRFVLRSTENIRLGTFNNPQEAFDAKTINSTVYMVSDNKKPMLMSEYDGVYYADGHLCARYL